MVFAGRPFSCVLGMVFLLIRMLLFCCLVDVAVLVIRGQLICSYENVAVLVGLGVFEMQLWGSSRIC